MGVFYTPPQVRLQSQSDQIAKENYIFATFCTLSWQLFKALRLPKHILKIFELNKWLNLRRRPPAGAGTFSKQSQNRDNSAFLLVFFKKYLNFFLKKCNFLLHFGFTRATFPLSTLFTRSTDCGIRTTGLLQ